jgi:hypothetical protein
LVNIIYSVNGGDLADSDKGVNVSLNFVVGADGVEDIGVTGVDGVDVVDRA